MPVGSEVSSRLEEACGSMGLVFKRLSLKKFPGSVHWHITKPGEKGTLEATWWEGKFWFSVHENRRSEWVDGVVATLSLRLIP